MISEWFKDWFNTPEYLNVYRHRNESDAEQHIDLITSNILLNPDSKILDMACGAGRHAILLARKGYNVTGVDLSENLLSIAEELSLNENLPAKFIHSDIREYISEMKFDLILNLFTSFGYFETDDENFSILKKAYDLLKPGGSFVLDVFNSYYLTKNLVEFSEEKINNSEIHQYREIKDKRVIKKIVVTKDGKLSRYLESVRMYTIEELENVLNKIGFDIYKTFGDFLGNEFEHFNSPRLILICRK
jgi:SAM-dependent methyltransferase